MAFVIKCNACSHRLPWKPTDKTPSECPKCGASFGEERDDSDVVMPFIRSAKTTNNDKLYRDMEKGSEVRAELGAQAAGCSVSDMSAMKMTDMRDNQREGDIAAKMVPTADDGKFFQPNGAEYAAGTANGVVTLNGQVTTGIQPRAGIRAMSTIQGIMGKSV